MPVSLLVGYSSFLCEFFSLTHVLDTGFAAWVSAIVCLTRSQLQLRHLHKCIAHISKMIKKLL